MGIDTMVAFALAVALGAVVVAARQSRRAWRRERQALRLEAGRMVRLLAAQRERMKAMAQRNLELRRYIESPPAGLSTPHTDCDCPDAAHGSWGCMADGCRCLMPRPRLDELAKAVVA